MKIVNTTGGFDAKIGVADTVRLNCEAGFEGIDLSVTRAFCEDGYKSLVREIKDITDSYGVTFEQSHGPIRKVKILDVEPEDQFLFRARRSIEVSGELGIKNMIIHPIRLAPGSHEDQLGYNLELFEKLIPDAKGAGVRLAIENMCGYKEDVNGKQVKHVCKTPEELAKYIDAFNSEWITGCLDTGHARISGESPAEFVRMLGRDRLTALHIQDCDGVGDLHTLPFLSKIEWQPFIEALAEIKYKGNITLEAVLFMKNMPTELYPAAARYMAEVARYIRDGVVARM